MFFERRHSHSGKIDGCQGSKGLQLTSVWANLLFASEIAVSLHESEDNSTPGPGADWEECGIVSNALMSQIRSSRAASILKHYSPCADK